MIPYFCFWKRVSWSFVYYDNRVLHAEINTFFGCFFKKLYYFLFVCFAYSRLQLETDLKIEKEWRQTLEEDLQKEKETVSRLRLETQEIINLKKVSCVVKLN